MDNVKLIPCLPEGICDSELMFTAVKWRQLTETFGVRMHGCLYNSICRVTLPAALQATLAQQPKHPGMSAVTGHWCIAYNLLQSFRLSRVRSFALSCTVEKFNIVKISLSACGLAGFTLSVIVYYGVQMRRVRL